MARLSLYPNDAGVTLLDATSVGYREPGVALLDNDRLVVGNSAFAQARVNPRRIQHNFWSSLSTSPLVDKHFEHLTAADLVSQQLEELWARCASSGDTLVVAVPAYMGKDHLGLLLGIGAELGIPIAAMVDAAVAATRREYVNAVPVHIDIGLHTTSMTRLAQVGQVQVEKTEVLEDCGLYELYDTWISGIAEAFVEQSRFDPLHTAETEQMLLNRLGDWLGVASKQSSIVLELTHAGLSHRAEIESLRLIGVVAPFYQRMASQLRALFRAGDIPALQVTDRVSRLPGLTDMLRARVGGEAYALEPGATARGALARLRELSAADAGVSLRRQLPWDQSAFEVPVSAEESKDASIPTHILFQHTAYRIGHRPLTVGSLGGGDEDRLLALGSDMPGVSRRHCTITQVDGRCVVEDSSRYGTFLNGHRIDGSTVLQVGDTLRVGSPGYEMTLITTDEHHGT